MGEETELEEREIVRQPSTERTKRLKKRFLESKITTDPERIYYFTQHFKKTEGKPILTRRAEAYKYTLSNLAPTVYSDELIVGNQTRYLRGSSPFPELAVDWMERAFSKTQKKGEEYFEQEGEGGKDQRKASVVSELGDEDKKMLEDAIDYWRGNSLEDITNSVYGWTGKLAIVQKMMETLVFAPTVMPMLEGHMSLDYSNVLKSGLTGIIEECQGKIDNFHFTEINDEKKIIFWNAVIVTCEGVIQFALNYASEAEKLAQEEPDPQRKSELEKIAGICKWVPANPARNFHEALQFCWFLTLSCHLESHGLGFSPGRADQYLYPFYKRDKEEGNLVDEEALELLECFRFKYSDLELSFDPAYTELLQGTLGDLLMVGGVTGDGADASNELSLLFLESVITTQTIQPTLAIRYSDHLSEEVLLKAVELVKTGIGMPAWFNDGVSIPHILKYYSGVSIDEARDYAMDGCANIVLSGNSYGAITPGWINMGKILELALNDGIDPMSKTQVGLHTGNSETMSFEEIAEAYQRQLSHALKLYAEYWNVVMSLHRDMVPSIFSSALTDNCIEKGRGLDEGGAKYNVAPIIIGSGIINVANSLAAIKQCVFEKKWFTVKELKKALGANFEDGFREIHKRLLETPKFGNDDDYVDLIAKDLYASYADLIYSIPNHLGGQYRPSTTTVSSHPPFGMACGALPDGRKAGLALCDGGLSAFPGTDVNGPSGLFNSASKIDSIPYSGTLLNLKFHPNALEGIRGSQNLLSLIKTYFDRGGYHIQFNVVDSKMLKDAQNHPESYRDLIVRIAGFSAYWIELSKIVQDEIIRRSEYDVI